MLRCMYTTIQSSLPPLTGIQSFVLGAISKALATLATYPYIRAKVLNPKP